ncbi:hypothetical protein [Bacillus stercoris]
MTFTKWYRYTYKEEWHEDYTYLYKFADEVTRKYEEWCKNNSQSPVWDG